MTSGPVKESGGSSTARINVLLFDGGVAREIYQLSFVFYAATLRRFNEERARAAAVHNVLCIAPENCQV